MLVFSYQRIGEALLRLKKYDEALAMFGAYLSMSEEGRRKDPVHNALLFDVSNAHEKVGDALRGLGKLPEALREYRLQLAIAGPLVAKDTSNAAWQRNLANSHQRIGLVLKELGETKEALDEFRQCAAISIKKTAWTPRSTWPPDINDYCRQQVAELGGSTSGPTTGK
jgi:tetratricopeptide (TPR) repeat protein